MRSQNSRRRCLNRTGPQYGFGLYLHWPYCTRICPYCDFNVYAAKSRDTSGLIEAMSRDLRAHFERLGDHPPLQSIFFGGGTPSLMNPAQLEEIISLAEQTFGLAPGAEVTLEANPNDILTSDIPDWRHAGINRLSIGVQSLRDDALMFLGRDHDANSALSAVTEALAEFPSVSIDLIYARPDQSLTQWEEELREALRLGAHHLSLYELTIEQRTAFGKAAARGDLIPMPDERQADLYEATQDITASAGFDAYEVSNHAISENHQSTHNMIYWQSGDWIGIGPGAHGRLTVDGNRVATEAAYKPGDYVDAPRPLEDKLDEEGVSREILAMGLRPAIGVAIDRISGLNLNALEELTALGLVAVTDGRLHTTQSGRLLTDAIAARLSP